MSLYVEAFFWLLALIAQALVVCAYYAGHPFIDLFAGQCVTTGVVFLIAWNK